MTNQVLHVTLDLSDIESADDGDTTYYGGFYTFNGEKHQARGNDRSDTPYEEVFDRIFAAANANWPGLNLSDDEDNCGYLFDAMELIESSNGPVRLTITLISGTKELAFDVGSVP